MTKFLNNVDVKGYVSQTDVTSSLLKADPTGKLVAAIAGTDYQSPTALASADRMVTVGRNATGATLYKGTIVYISGSTGNRPNFVKAQANGEATSAGTFGVVYADIPNNTDGNVVTIGVIDTLDTRSNATNPFTSDTLADGDTIYLSPTTAGYITNVKPSAPNHLVYLGKVVRTSPTNGTIVYRVQNGYELEELHDVALASLINNQGLFYEVSAGVGLWKNKTIAEVLGYTPEQPLTFSSPLVRTVNTISIPVATGSVNGYLSSTDWTTFNNKQDALTNPVTGTGTTGYVTFWNGTNTVTADSALFWNNTSKRLGINTVVPSTFLHVYYNSPAAAFTDIVQIGSANGRSLFIGTNNYGFSLNDSANRGGWGIDTDNDSGFMRFYYGASEKVRFQSNGYVGIGLTYAAYKLDVAGDINVTGNFKINGVNINSGTVTSVSGTGTVSGLTLTGTVTSSGSLTLGGTLSLTSLQVTTALGYTPYNSTNPSGYITSSALSSYLPLTGGTLTGNIVLGSGTINSIPSWMKVITTDATQSGLGAVYNNKAVYLYNNGSAIKLDAYDYGTSTGLNIQIGGNGGKIIASNGQVQFTAYTTSTSFSGTAAGYLAFDSSGNIITVAGVAATDNTKLPFNGVSTRFTGDVNTLGLSGTTGVYNLGVATNAPSTYGTLLGFWNTDISTQLYLSYNGSAYWRPSASNTFVGAAWRTFLDSSNYNSYALPLSGGTMSGILAFSNTTGNKIDFYYTISAGVGDRYGIQVQSSELRIHSGAQGAGSGGITFGKSDSSTFTEAMRVRNDGLIAVVNNLVVGSQQGYDNPGGWNKNILIDGTNHGRFRIKASNYTYGNIDVALWADSSVSPSHGINGSNAVFAFNGAITTLTVGGQTVIHTGNIGSQSVNYATTSGTASNISAYTINQNLGTGNSPSFADGIFGTTGGATDQGIQIRYQNYVSGYGRIRFYQSDSNHQTIHSFSATWQNGTLAGASAGAINIAGQNGVTFGDWNNADAYIVKGGQTYARGYRGIGNVAGTGEATYHPAGVYSTGTNWLYGTIYMNNNPIRDVMDIYNNSWFRNNGSLTGLYNQTNGNHFYSNASAEWSITGAGGNVGLVFKSNHESGLRGYVYGDTSSNFGLLNNQGGWSVMCYPGTGYGGDLKGTWTMAGNTIITSANIGSQTVDGLNTTFLNTGSTNISSGYSRVIRNENGSGGNPTYAPVLHLAASDTMWQIAGAHGGSTTLVWRSGYAGNWTTAWWNILHSGNASYAWNMNQNVRTSDNVTFNYVNAPSGYVSNGNPWGTSNSAYFPNGITTAGSTNWIYGHTYVGNAPGNGNGHEFWASGDSRHTGTITPNYIGRPSHSTGFLVGSYNNIGGNSTNTNPIYTIGSGYLPSDSSLVSMYGIGYSHPNFWGSGKVQGWGMYVCSAGSIDAVIGGDGSSTSIWAKTDIVAYSDARVKENVEVIPNALDKVNALRGVTFTRNDVKDKTKRSAGVIAQEVLAVLPEVVSGTEKDMYSVAYGNMAGLFIEAIKEQQAQILSQGAQITELMEIIKTLRGL